MLSERGKDAKVVTGDGKGESWQPGELDPMTALYVKLSSRGVVEGS